MDTRWLSTQPVLERIQKKWGTITQYFCTFVKNSNDQNEKNARKTARYKRILEFLEPGQNQLMYTTICWAIHLAKKTKSFLTMFQKEGPMVQRLWSASNVLVKTIMEMFLKKAPDVDKELEQLDLSVRSGWKKVEHLDIGDVVRTALLKISPDLKEDLLRKFRSSAKAMAAYLQVQLPITNSVLKWCFYLCPVTRKSVVEEDQPEVKKSVLRQDSCTWRGNFNDSVLKILRS